MQVKHRGSLYNDNLDGTLSQVGYYNKPLPGQATTPALIISQNPLDGTEPPMETSSLPNTAANTKEKKAKKTKKIILTRNGTLPLQPSDSAPATFLFQGNARKTWESMLPYLPRPLTCMSAITANQQTLDMLLSLPRKRDIRWRNNWVKRRLDDDYRQVVGLLLHLIGDEHLNGLKEKACTHCRRGEGPFSGCYVLPKDAAFEAHTYTRCCANCYFRHAKESCSIKASWQVRMNGDKSNASAGWHAPSVPAAGAGAANKRRRLSDSEMDFENEEPRRSGRYVDDAELRRRTATLSTHLKEDRTTPSSGEAVLKRSASNGAPFGAASSSAALIDAGKVDPDGLLEMEDWEVAPGSIRMAGTERINSKPSHTTSSLSHRVHTN